MGDGLESLPNDIETLKAALIVARAEAAAARARQSDDQALIAHLKLQIEKLNRDRYGPRSERTARLLDQLELTLEELESSATEDELAAEMAAAKTTKVASFTRKRPSRQPFPEHLRDVIASHSSRKCSKFRLQAGMDDPRPPSTLALNQIARWGMREWRTLAFGSLQRLKR
jgi:hypothetical protein